MSRIDKGGHLVPLLLLAACGVACDQPSVAADIEAVIALDDAVHAAVEAGDLDAVMEFWTEDAHLLGPGFARVSGRDEIQEFFRNAFESLTLQFERSSEEVIVSGDLAVHRGFTVATYAPSGDSAVVDPQKWVDIYRRQADGSWLIWLTIWNSDLPAGATVFEPADG